MYKKAYVVKEVINITTAFNSGNLARKKNIKYMKHKEDM